jgi:hypothetical protein
MGRAIPADFKHDIANRAPLEEVAESIKIAQEHFANSYGILASLDTPELSPDGKLGGAGFIRSIEDIKASLAQAILAASTLSDTVVDELNTFYPKQEDIQEVEREILEPRSLELEDADPQVTFFEKVD